MHRNGLAGVVLLLLALSACARSSRRGNGASGFTTIAATISDPARNQVYVGDATSGRVVAISATTGDPVREILLGSTIGGMALDHCFRQLYVGVTGGLRIDVVDADTFQRTASLRLGTGVYALAAGLDGHLLAVTGRGLLDLALATLQTTTLKAAVDRDALLCTDRLTTRAFLIEEDGGEIVVSCFDLTQLGALHQTSAPGAMAGRPVGAAVSFDGATLWVATDGADGVYRLDAATLQVIEAIDAGPGLAAMATTTTGTRMYVSRGDPLVQSLNLDTYAAGRDVIAAADVAERGVHVAPNNLGLVLHGEDGSISSYATFDVGFDVPTALRQGGDYTATIQGTPHAPWYLFMSLAPGYIYLDPPTAPDPRFLDLSLADAFRVLNFGVFDAAGRAQLVETIPTDVPATVDFVVQVAEAPPIGFAAIEVSNPLVVRFLGPDCN